jgi:hypothetical protein
MMNDQPVMNRPPEVDDAWEDTLRQTARQFGYPPTPDIAGKLRGRLRPARRSHVRLTLARVAAVVVLLCAGLLAISPLRAAVLEFLQIGGIRVQVVPPADSTPAPDAVFQDAVLYPAVEITLTEARQRLAYEVRLPGYPPDVGAPDRVYLREADRVLALVWLDETDPDEIRLILYHLPPEAAGFKTVPEVIQETSVNQHRAVWIEGEHWLRFDGDNLAAPSARQVIHSVLIWSDDGLTTYRLETTLAKEEATRIAESVR